MSRQKNLAEIIQTRYSTANERPDCSILFGSQLNSEFERIYRKLGGSLPCYPVNVGAYDVFATSFAVELDEERHFNRYREITLDSNIYDQIIKFPVDYYKNFCLVHEDKCLRAAGWGGNWSSASTEKQFGHANIPRILEDNGSPRWKQRAFYDLLKDAMQLFTNIPLVRLSIYDEFDTVDGIKSVNEILNNENYLDYSDDIIEFIIKRC